MLGRLLSRCGINVEKIHYFLQHLKKQDILYNVNNSRHEKRCLLIYITQPFLVDAETAEKHQNFWQVKEIARTIDSFGYVVDVADYCNPRTKPNKNYDLVIGLIPRALDIYSKHLNVGAKKIAYLTSSNLEFTALQEEQRLADLKNRRGVSLKPRRNAGKISKNIETFDAAFFIGNEYNFLTYKDFKMPPTFYIKNNGYVFDREIDFSKKSATNFVYFGSGGQVHKGLDILLEVFSEENFPCNLYVCGSYESEQDFCDLYYEELYNRKNIFPMGFVSVGSDRFFDIMDKCAYMLMPSCAEGVAGAVLTVKSAGVIPIISKVCGFDESDAILLDDCKIDTVKQYVLKYSQQEKSWIEENAEKSVKNIQEKYTRKHFTESIQKALHETLLK